MNSRLTDMDINVAVRRVLVRHWIDLGRISVRTTRGVVWLSGSLLRIKNAGSELGNEEMLSIFQEMKNVHGVRRLHPQVLNWQGDIETITADVSVKQKGPVNTYEAKMTSMSLREWMEANKAEPQKAPAEEAKPSPAATDVT